MSTLLSSLEKHVSLTLEHGARTYLALRVQQYQSLCVELFTFGITNAQTCLVLRVQPVRSSRMCWAPSLSEELFTFALTKTRPSLPLDFSRLVVHKRRDRRFLKVEQQVEENEEKGCRSIARSMDLDNIDGVIKLRRFLLYRCSDLYLKHLVYDEELEVAHIVNPHDVVESKFIFEAKFIQVIESQTSLSKFVFLELEFVEYVLLYDLEGIVVNKIAIVQTLRMSSHQDTTSFNYLDLYILTNYVTTDGRLIIVFG
uniref:Uncharacterized protein n=1 Tax=Cucumis melo TaxID=3656 RepID=A0A9I9EKR1_CUCME